MQPLVPGSKLSSLVWEVSVWQESESEILREGGREREREREMVGGGEREKGWR